MKMTVPNGLRRKKEAVERELERILPHSDSSLDRAMRYAVLNGGKRFRPLLALSSGECFGVEATTMLPVACSIELIHNYSLVHDDMPAIDNDDFRRGKPSCHREFGEAIALLVGDGLLTLAFEVLASPPFEGDRRTGRMEAIAAISRAAGWGGMIGGQFLDISLSPDRIRESDLVDLMGKKTAALIQVSVQVGAILSSADRKDREAADEFGRNLGLAFQTRDDIVDSLQDSTGGGSPRPNSVTLFGLPEARMRLERFVSTALEALERLPGPCSELRHLALMVRSVEG